jgi:tellurite methyltransferase
MSPASDPNPPAAEGLRDSAPDRGSERERWNRKYAERGVEALRRAPAQWLEDNEDLLTGALGRRALDIACGDGRNAGYLANLGFTVDAVDISDVAIAALRAAATERHLSVIALRIDLARDPLPAADYDVIVQFNYLQRSLLPALPGALATGGILIVETMTRAHAEPIDRPMDPRFLLEPGELRTAFPELELLRYRDGVFEGGNRHRALASLVARHR